MYIPFIAAQILDENKREEFQIPLKGVAIGNGTLPSTILVMPLAGLMLECTGWIDSIIMSESYFEYGYSHGLISKRDMLGIKRQWSQCLLHAEESHVLSRRVVGSSS
jgi:carboxypeptidase C (cathepsin A)